MQAPELPKPAAPAPKPVPPPAAVEKPAPKPAPAPAPAAAVKKEEAQAAEKPAFSMPKFTAPAVKVRAAGSSLTCALGLWRSLRIVIAPSISASYRCGMGPNSPCSRCTWLYVCDACRRLSCPRFSFPRSACPAWM